VFYLRPARRDDLPALQKAAEHLDSVNLPNDEGRLAESIDRSLTSFAAANPPAARELLFVLVERGTDGSERAIGSSMVFAQHGSRRSPHIFFDVIDEERYSETLDRHFRHKVLRIGYNYDGLTEIGGLVLLPEYRGHPEQLGKSLVNVRFLYIALHRAMFREEIVSELLPPLEPDGTSLLWEALGRNFTDLSYQEADRLSRENKEFIRALFPQDPIYASLLPAKVQDLIGVVGPHTKAVEKILVRAGFSYAQRIDPFDGGPHFHARTDDLQPIQASRPQVPVLALVPAPGGDATPALVAVDLPGPPYFLAVRALCSYRGEGVILPGAAAAVLGVKPGDSVGLLGL
jgi:arginine N-succinyltransferase